MASVTTYKCTNIYFENYSGTFVAYLVHLTEFLTPSWRSLCGAVPFWCVGEMLLGLLAYLIPNWRYLTVATAAPAFVVLLFFP